MFFKESLNCTYIFIYKSTAMIIRKLKGIYLPHEPSESVLKVPHQKTFLVHRQRRNSDSGAGRALCVEMGFMWTFPRNQDAKVKLKSELISIKF